MRTAPNSRINVGVIATGGMGTENLKAALSAGEVQVVAVCDVDADLRAKAKALVDERYAGQHGQPTAGLPVAHTTCAAYNDFRDLLAREDIDAVIISTPDHWHAVMAIEAAKAGKDIYCEKPLSLTIREARAMVTAVRRYGRVFQTGTQQRSEYSGKFRFACELVRSGYIGKVESVYVGVGGPPMDCDLPAHPVPPGLDWNLWLGPAQWRPFNKALHPYSWRPYREFSGGQMANWGSHHFDIVQWALGTDDTGPVEVHPPDGKEHRVLTFKYASGVNMYHMFGPGTASFNLPTGKPVSGILFVGDAGWIEVDRDHLAAAPESLLKQTLGPNDVHLRQSPGHLKDWLNCIRTREQPICDVEIGCRSVTICHLGNLAFLLGRSLRWDPQREEFPGDADANRLLDRPKRAPWRIE